MDRIQGYPRLDSPPQLLWNPRKQRTWAGAWLYLGHLACKPDPLRAPSGR